MICFLRIQYYSLQLVKLDDIHLQLGCWLTAALVCRLASVWRKRRHLRSASNGHRWSLACLVLSHACLVSCAVVPMSCGCLIDGERWVSISLRDDVHDNSLFFSYVGTIASGVLAGYGASNVSSKDGRRPGRIISSSSINSRKRPMLYCTCLFAVLQSWGIYRCPTSTDAERLVLLLLEVLAIALAQFLHHGTVDHLFHTSQTHSHGKGSTDHADLYTGTPVSFIA